MKRIALALLVAIAAVPAFADTSCRMTFSMKGWSVFYKTASGSGTITCDNGQSAHVKLEAKGGGITAGKFTVKNGRGKFSPVGGINDLFGTYVSANAGAAAGRSASATAMTKGEVSLALAGKGTGVEIGIAFGKFTIERR